MVPPEELLPGLATLPVAVGLTATVPATATAALASLWATIQAVFTSKVIAGAAAVAVATAGTFAYVVIDGPAPGTDAAPVIVDPTVTTAPTAPATSGPPRAPAGVAPTARDPGVTGVTDADIFVAPNGSDSGTGRADRPYATLAKAVSVVRPGQTIALRGGTYRPTEPVGIRTSGTATQRITISNYRAERPVIDASRVPADKWMITHQASYWTVQGLEIRNSGSHAYVCVSCRYNVFQRLVIHDNVRSSLTLRDAGTVGNRVLDCDFFNNHDPADPGGVGIGLAVKFGAGEDNVIRGNRAFNNAADGFDLGSFASAVAVEYNWAYGNGVNRWNLPNWESNGVGFRLGGGSAGPAAHAVRHNAAWSNVGHGFYDGGNQGGMQLNNNTAYRNGGVGFAFPRAAATLRSNAAVDNGAPVQAGAEVDVSRNTWQTGDDGTAMFRSTDPRTAQGRRAPDGTLAPTDFLHIGTGVGASMSGD